MSGRAGMVYFHWQIVHKNILLTWLSNNRNSLKKRKHVNSCAKSTKFYIFCSVKSNPCHKFSRFFLTKWRQNEEIIFLRVLRKLLEREKCQERRGGRGQTCPFTGSWFRSYSSTVGLMSDGWSAEQASRALSWCVRPRQWAAHTCFKRWNSWLHVILLTSSSSSFRAR